MRILLTIFLLMVVAPTMHAIELTDFSQFNRALNGVAWGNETETYISTNFATYIGKAWEGKMAKLEPSIDVGLLNYQDISFDSLDALVEYLKENTIADITVNVVEASKMFPVLNYVANALPQWVYIGAGGGLRYTDDWEFEGKFIGAVKITY